MKVIVVVTRTAASSEVGWAPALAEMQGLAGRNIPLAASIGIAR